MKATTVTISTILSILAVAMTVSAMSQLGITTPTATKEAKPTEQTKPEQAKPTEAAPNPGIVALPFGVTVGGQKAAVANANDTFATVPQPVANNAELAIDVAVEMTIVNAFPCDDKGTPAAGATAVVILFEKNAKTVALDKTMDKKPLPAGKYLMNIVAGSNTARVVFTVK